MNSPFIIDFKIKTNHVSQDEFKNLVHIYQQNHEFTHQQMIDFFNTLIFNARLKLLDISDGSMTNLCDTAQSMIGQALDTVGILVHVLDIGAAISSEAYGHSIIIADVQCEGKKQSLLVDITYQQFCLLTNCQESCYMTKDGYILMTPHPGYIAVQEKRRENTIKTLLEHGYLPWHESVAKDYCDTFYLSRTGKIEEIIKNSYTGEEYLEKTKNTNVNYSKTKEELQKMNLWIDTEVESSYQR